MQCSMCDPLRCLCMDVISYQVWSEWIICGQWLMFDDDVFLRTMDRFERMRCLCIDVISYQVWSEWIICGQWLMFDDDVFLRTMDRFERMYSPIQQSVILNGSGTSPLSDDS
ncbi:hypothetical protein KP509_24G009300 [Ceratopteris richardii]|uniref:Uncharacterized protein n=1 Tax=Ceratopteris richardii TaxID=49495 RepID=A0A8T2RSE0_CERRI|nr:hypothetical protein KP509_24G009300 [Ceratopteris richardii]